MIPIDNIIEAREEACWQALTEAAIAGNVIPVIGPDVLCDLPGGLNINEYLVAQYSEGLNIGKQHSTFSQLVYDPKFLANFPPNVNRDIIYSMIDNVFTDKASYIEYFKPSEMLLKLLRTKMFPFVITTSFSPIVEDAMREVWEGREVRVLNFCNDPARDIKPGTGDIYNESDMDRPTVYYMFGKVWSRPHSYVLTDHDMLEFCRSWLSEQTRPANLCAQLKDKYLLMLGCGYSDWLFRLIWFCMSKTNDVKTTGLTHRDSTKESDLMLIDYLERMNAFLPKELSADKSDISITEDKPAVKLNPFRPRGLSADKMDTFLLKHMSVDRIIDNIVKRLKKHNTDNPGEWFNSVPLNKTDIFISYSRRDSLIAEKLYKQLTELGYKVWYDKKDIGGGMNFMEAIYHAIEKTRLFIPLITPSVVAEEKDPHVYRQEWGKALTLQKSMGRRTFIIPVCPAGFDVKEAYLPGIKDYSFAEYDSQNLDFDEVIKAVTQAFNQ